MVHAKQVLFCEPNEY